MTEEFKSFLKIVDEINGLYLDATTAFREWAKRIEYGQKEIAARQGISMAQLDQQIFGYVENDDERERGNFKHFRTQFEIKTRNQLGGKNHSIIANLCIVLIYQYWEMCRLKLEKKNNLKMNSIKSDTLGDIRHLRNSILKHGGIGNRELKKCKVIKWFNEGDLININAKKFEGIIGKYPELKTPCMQRINVVWHTSLAAS